MVSDAFEGLRTYDCWLRYICQSVRFSAVADPRQVEGLGILGKDIGILPGCQAPEDLAFSERWAEFARALANDQDAIAVFDPYRLALLPACMTDPPNNQSPKLDVAESRYQACLQTAELILGCPEDSPNCSQQSSAFVGLEAFLQKTHADRKAQALESKLMDLAVRTGAMQQVAEQAKTQLKSVEQRYECSPEKCD